jgi:putative two-component system response regulator
MPTRWLIRTHAGIGARILADSHCELIQIGAEIAAAHHERWDGSGYPRGLKGADIPIEARVVAVADVFDALTTKHPYKEAMPLHQARRYLEDKKGIEFDPTCVDAFLARWDEVEAIARPHGGPMPEKIAATS